MKLIVLIVTSIVGATASELDEWSAFKMAYEKKYNNRIEEKYRMTVFLKNKKMIEEHNEKYSKGLVSFYMRMNHFGDLTIEEFRSMMGKSNMPGTRTKNVQGDVFIMPGDKSIPDAIDWREKGALTQVKIQGECGASSYFTVTGVLESQSFIKTGKLVPLSEQNLMDCTWVYGNTGCWGGAVDYSFRYIQENGGIDTEEAYPYLAKSDDGGPCRFNKSAIGATASGYVDLPEKDEEALKAAVATIGPIAVAIDSQTDSFPFYAGGDNINYRKPNYIAAFEGED